MPHRLLVIEDGRASAHGVHAALARDEAFVCHRVNWDEFVPERLRAGALDLIVAVAVPDQDKMAGLFEWRRGHPIAGPVLAVLPDDAAESLLRSVVQIADDFIVHPAGALELRHRISRLLTGPRHDEADVSKRLIDEMGLTKLVGRAPVFVRAIEQVPRFARSDASVLITGETGTGKELCARAIHHLSRRRSYPFIAVDCGAVPDQLFENELFGHARGAFTDAHRDQKGLLALADGGTLFLDEIDALSLAAQAKLLRFLQEHTFRPLGSERFDRSNVKVVAATNRNLEVCMRDKQFRTDLFFRLNVLRIHLPPLRERTGDIPLLANSLLKECSASVDSPPTAFSDAALRILTAYSWPGNVRELYNVVQRAVVECEGDTILPSHISVSGDLAAPELGASGEFRAARAAAVAAFERRYVEELLRKHRGNVTHAAREAHQDRRAFGRFIRKYRIDRLAP